MTQVATLGNRSRQLPLRCALYATMLVTVVDNTVLNVALPSIAAHFGAGTAQLQAAVDSYIVVCAGLLLVAGVVSDRYGPRRAALAGLIIFGCASGLAVLTSSVWWLIAMRAVMGVGAALIGPSVSAVFLIAFTSEERTRVLAGWFVVGSVALALGPVVGGILVSLWGWAGIFLINLPIVVLAAAGIFWLVPEVHDTQPRRLDLWGATLVTAGLLVMITVVIMIGESRLSDPLLFGGAAIAVVALWGFWWQQRRMAEPMIDLSLYRDRQFAGAAAVVALLAVAIGGALFVLTQYLQLVRGDSPFAAGMAVLPIAVGTVFGSIAGGRAAPVLGSRVTVLAGLVLIVAGFVIMANLIEASSYTVLTVAMLLIGGGGGFAGPALTNTMLNAVPRDRAGVGSAMSATHPQLGNALGVAGLGSLLATTYHAGLPEVVPEGAARSLTATLAYAASTPDGANLATAARGAFGDAQTIVMAVAACCALAAAVVVITVLKPDERRASTVCPGGAEGQGARGKVG